MVRSHARRSGISSVDDLESESVSTETATITVNVPTDYDTLNEAINNVRARMLPESNLSEITINIESGHQISETILCEHSNYAQIRVVSEDATVPVASSFPDGDQVILITDGSTSPVFDCKFDAQNNGYIGVHISVGSIGVFNSGFENGFINAGNDNVRCENGSLGHFYGNDLSGSGKDGVLAQKAASVTLGIGADLSGAAVNGASCGKTALLRIRDADCSNAGASGLLASEGAIVYAQGADFSNASKHGIEALGSRVYALDGVINDVGDRGIFAAEAATVTARGVSISNATVQGAIARRSSTVDLWSGSVTGSGGNDIALRAGGQINAESCVTSSSSGTSPHVSDVSVPFNSVQGEGIIFAENFEQ